ncbi:MAG: hemerythrin domain-containing protein [Eikenella sp.]|nr:hemerythrin domain-containing protein [Eikenella sp.]
MKRHPLLIPLSQEHHHALSLCLRILRDPAADQRAGIAAQQDGLLAHFTAEETQFAPLWAALNRPDLQTRFAEDHACLRAMLAAPLWDDPEWKRRFADTLREHVRFEERALFPALTPLLPEAT